MSCLCREAFKDCSPRLMQKWHVECDVARLHKCGWSRVDAKADIFGSRPVRDDLLINKDSTITSP